MKASITIRHDRMTADRWQTMLRVDGVAFAIGAACATLKEAEDVRMEFRRAIEKLMLLDCAF